MNNTDNTYRLLQTLAETSSTKTKKALLAEHATDTTFCNVLRYALDPYLTYGIAQIPSTTAHAPGKQFDASTWKLLDDLAARNITGNAARAALNTMLESLSRESASVLRYIVTKDLRAGVNDSLVADTIKDLLPTFPYMRCCLPKDTKLGLWPWERGVYSQQKADGMFANVNVEEGYVTISSRSGTLFPMESFSTLAKAAAATFAVNTQNHGELLVRKAGKILDRQTGNGIINSVIQGGAFADDEELIFEVWDQIPLSSVKRKGKCDTPYSTRFNNISSQLEKSTSSCIRLITTRVVHSMKEAYAHYGEMLAAGWEGTVIKHPDAVWRDGTSKQQVKLKLEFECDLMIVGFLKGNGKNAELFGSIECETQDGLLRVAVSGFKDKKQPGIPTRQEIYDMREELTGTIMAVKANDILTSATNDGLHSLFLPRFVEFRKDKTVADTLQRVIEQRDAARALAVEGV